MGYRKNPSDKDQSALEGNSNKWHGFDHKNQGVDKSFPIDGSRLLAGVSGVVGKRYAEGAELWRYDGVFPFYNPRSSRAFDTPDAYVGIVGLLTIGDIVSYRITVTGISSTSNS